MGTCERIEYGGWTQAHRLSNGIVELTVVSEIGPRIMSFSFQGRHNLFRNLPQDMGQTGGATFRLYGGQRLWAAPENPLDTYFPDNEPAAFQQISAHEYVVAAPVEESTGLQKEMRIRLADGAACVRVAHTIANRGTAARRFAPWALSIMNLNGVAIAPLPPYGSHAEHLSPAGLMALWAYTDLTDPRWQVGDKYVLLRQDALAGSPQKIGLQVRQGWAAYVLDGLLFVKTFGFDAAAAYPDYGCNTELFTDHRMLEIESLGPLADVRPGQAASQTETWHLFADVDAPASDDEVDAWIMPHVETALRSAAG